MKIISGSDAYKNLIENVRAKDFRMPNKLESNYIKPNGNLLPKISTKFKIERNENIFTIGSCFAREIENILSNLGPTLPIKEFSLPANEFIHPAPHLLNEYNTGTILQRIESIYGNFKYTSSMGIEESNNGYIDLFLHINQNPVDYERLLLRRIEIQCLYEKIKNSSMIIITLGLVEAWFDNENMCYLNKAPRKSTISQNAGRFSLHRMDLDDVLERMSSVISLINKNQNTKILLTVSPIPIEATFQKTNAILANQYSKSVLRVAVENLTESFDNVFYFPSYEIATSAGTNSFSNDNIHLNSETIDLIVGYLVDNYLIDNLDNREEVVVSETYIDSEIINRLNN